MGGDRGGPSSHTGGGIEDAGRAGESRGQRAHRTGGALNADRPRTVIVKFAAFKVRDAVLQATRSAKPRGIYINEDFSTRVISRRRDLIPEMKEARERGKIAYLSYDKLVVKDRLERQQR